jgi:hypothetical protein
MPAVDLLEQIVSVYGVGTVGRELEALLQRGDAGLGYGEFAALGVLTQQRGRLHEISFSHLRIGGDGQMSKRPTWSKPTCATSRSVKPEASAKDLIWELCQLFPNRETMVQ